MPSLTVTSLGLLYESTDFSDWTLGSFWEAVEFPTFGAFGKTSILLEPTPAGDDAAGIREIQILRRPGIEWMVYDAGKGDVVAADTGWRQFFASSTDGGFNWTKHGPSPIGYTNGDDEESLYAARATGWLEYRTGVGKYYLHTIPVVNVFTSGPNLGLPLSDYFGDQWQADEMLGTWTFVTSYMPEGWASNDLLPGSVIYDSPTYTLINEGGDGSTFKVGMQTASAATGPWVLDEDPLLDSTDFEGRVPENGKISPYAEPGFPGYVLTLNMIGLSPNNNKTDQNVVMTGPAIGNWRSDITSEVVQRIYDPDTCNGRAIGVLCPVTTADGEPVNDYGYLAYTFDSYPQSDESAEPPWALGRVACGVVLEPSRYVLACANLFAVAEYATVPLLHTDIYMKCIVKLSDIGAGSNHYIALRFRELELRVRANAGANWLALYNLSGTLLQNGSVTQAGVTLDEQMHVLISCIGDEIICKLGGEEQINYTDPSPTAGVELGAVSFSIVGSVRIVTACSGDSVTITDLPASETINFRAMGMLPLTQEEIEPDGSIVYGPLANFPIGGAQLASGGATARPPGGKIYPGDVLAFVADPLPPPPPRGVFRLM